MTPIEIYDGYIYGVETRVTPDGKPFNRILHYAKLPHYADLVQCSSRAVYYVERYGWDTAKTNALAYDPAFNIFENLENSRKAKADAP